MEKKLTLEPPLNPGESSQTSVQAKAPGKPKLPNDKIINEIIKGGTLDDLVQNEITKQLVVIREEMTEKIKEIRSTKRRWIEKVSYRGHYYMMTLFKYTVVLTLIGTLGEGMGHYCWTNSPCYLRPLYLQCHRADQGYQSF
jgi:hypothetical protein